ncbi:sporulation protein YqfD [Clostridium tertium]|uniref:Sporulation protein YqfD n=1 Tax=Clostridium tertium TaxID=1559 RepID=A0A9X4B2M4_9CLOT|nr:sporulation protein YqfD [Clostridium tertium]MDB1946621.1 sporulation protein YqfD [Clostridium tertium]MDC4241897.1 sporulation protein YqfD [Clostridium tertium]
MATGVFDSGKVVVEVNILKPERLLNILWNENINVINVKRIDVATIRVTIDYNDYNVLIDVVKRLNGKSKVIGSTGILFFIGKLKSKLFLAIGGGIFIALLLYFSTYVWSIEITTKKNVSPYELRQQLYEIGIKPGISKNKIDVKDVEKKLEDVNSDVLWLRARIEGSTLKIFIEEKVNPPEVKEEKQGNLVAKMDGEVSRVYAFSGRSAVHVGDMVKAGDIVIEGINGKEEDPYEVVPEGVVMANTFYEKSMTIKVEGTELKRSGEKDSDIYVEVFGKKIYLKKAIKDFEEYDKIEESGKIIKKANYFEKREFPVTYTKEEAIDSAVNELEESLYNNLTREAKVVDRIISTKDSSDGNIIVNVVFVVEQNIVNNEPIDY